MPANGPAQYIHGETKITKTVKVDQQGGHFEIKDTNSILYGVQIEVPPNALNKQANLSIGYNNGELRLKSGKSCGIVLVLEISNNLLSFEKPFKITARFNPEIKPSNIIGYAIDAKGSLRPLDTISNFKEQGIVSFYTFKPVMFTWVYIMR